MRLCPHIAFIFAFASASIQTEQTSLILHDSLASASLAPRFCIDREPGTSVIGLVSACCILTNVITYVACATVYVCFYLLNESIGGYKSHWLYFLDILTLGSSILPLLLIMQEIHFTVNGAFARRIFFLLVLLSVVGSIGTPIFTLIYTAMYPEKQLTLLGILSSLFMRLIPAGALGASYCIWSFQTYASISKILENHDIEELIGFGEVRSLPFSLFSSAINEMYHERRFEEIAVLMNYPKVAWYGTSKLLTLPIFDEKRLLNPKYLRLALDLMKLSDFPPDSHHTLRELLESREKYLVLACYDYLIKDISLHIISLLLLMRFQKNRLWTIPAH